MITNGKDTRLENTPIELPNLSDAVSSFMQRIDVGVIQKQQIDGYTQEITKYYKTQASIQPMSENLAIRKEGARSWRWYVIHVLSDVKLATDDVAVIRGARYRIMQKNNWDQYGFIEYHAIEDYTVEDSA